MSRPASIALIDISYLFKKRYHTTPAAERNAAAKATLSDIEWLSKDVGHLIICCDAPPYEQRVAVFAEYKANRPVPDPEEKAQKRWLFETLKRLGHPVARVQGFEADDVIATLAKSYSDWCDDVRIVGADKDCAQCITEHVTQYIPPIGAKDWEVRNVEGVKKKFGVTPAQMPLFQGLVGDAGDNIPGVPKIGETTAAKLVIRYGTIESLAKGLATEAAAAGSKPPAWMASLGAHWESLVMSQKLATLDTNVPLDAEALLTMSEPQPAEPRLSAMEVSAEAIQDATFEQPANDATPPTDWAAQPKIMQQRVAPSQALITLPGYSHSKYGLVTKDLQPLDLESAKTVSDWLFDGGVYPQFKSETQVFTVIARGKELGIGMTTALACHHMVEGKPVAHADLIRALAERDPNFEYLMPIEISATKCTWRGKHRQQPTHVDFSYTIEEAKVAGLVKLSQYGKPGNWMLRPQDMLMKTAASKLARLLWPGATLGMYCPEEMGYGQEELEAREAA